MKLITINSNNEPYYSEDFIKGFNCGAQRQFEADKSDADRPQGEWKGYEIPSECSVCGHHWDEYVFGQDIWHDGSVPNYCPHCGAKMKGADDD